MPSFTIAYKTEEDLCLLLTKTLQQLPKCELLLDGAGLVRLLRRNSARQPNVSTSGPVVQPTPQLGGSQAGGGTALFPTSGSPTSVTIEDPDDPGTLIEVPLSGGGPFPFGGGPFQTFSNLVNVQEADGTVTRKPLVPLDLDLLGALDPGPNPIGNLITGLSRAAAALLPTEETTISALLAKSGDTTIRATHLALLLPVIKAFPGPITDGVTDFLKNEADRSLLEGNISDLEAQVKVLDKGFDIPFISTSSEKETDVFDRIRGNLEILRIEQQEEF